MEKEKVVVDEKGNVRVSLPTPPVWGNRESRRRGLSKAGRQSFLSKDGKTIVSSKMQAQGAFGKPRNGTTKLSADKHRWVEPVAYAPKKKSSRKKKEATE